MGTGLTWSSSGKMGIGLVKQKPSVYAILPGLAIGSSRSLWEPLGVDELVFLHALPDAEFQ